MNTVKTKYRGTTKYIHVLAELVRAAQYRGVTTYQDIAVIMGLPMQGSHMGAELGWVLGEIAEFLRPRPRAGQTRQIGGRTGLLAQGA